jgi:hypothetical protein
VDRAGHLSSRKLEAQVLHVNDLKKGLIRSKTGATEREQDFGRTMPT